MSNVVKGVFVVQSQQTKHGSPLFLFISGVIYLTDVCTNMLSLQMSSLHGFYLSAFTTVCASKKKCFTASVFQVSGI